jgi:deoxyribodipyrimidine photo-lyase
MPLPALVWFRNDLRIADHPALHAAVETGKPVIPVYIFDEDSPGIRPMGGASKWWLHHALSELSNALAALGAPLLIARGPAAGIINDIIRLSDADAVFWNRRYDAPSIAVDAAIKSDFERRGIAAKSFNGSLLVEPWEVTTKTGQPMKVFTPFWRAAQARGEIAPPLPAPKTLPGHDLSAFAGLAISLDALRLLPTTPDWAGGMRAFWTPGEAGAQARLKSFLSVGWTGYAELRNRPDRDNTSRLSPHLRFGELSPRQVWHAGLHAREAGIALANAKDLQSFQSELGWREFSYHLLFHNPDLAQANFQPRFDAFPWRNDPDALRRWQRGLTGYPIVDAGMRQLWETGWMHNRVRMIVASFLIKDLMIDWREGEAWFWDTLVDADPASNSASWQWVAGSGADAAPYFRVFNPILQGAKFDPDGDYVRRYIPELRALPADVIHAPWEAGPLRLAAAGVRLGETYPLPMIDHSVARDRALAAFQSLPTLTA